LFAVVWIGWLRVIGPMQWWYAATLIGGLALAGTTIGAVLATIRQPAFRADRNGIRLGLRTERRRPRHRQAHLWWADVRQLRIEPRPYGVMLEISLGPAARIVRRRGPVRQSLLWCGMLVLPFCLGRGTPRLTEPRRKDPQYRVRLLDVTPEELGLALAALALPAVEIIVISRRYGPVMARRPQPAAPRPAAPRATAPPATAPPATAPPATAPPATAPAASAPVPAARPAASASRQAAQPAA
jgi:pyruvate/2-oxoglutarate dehydrogenase complex dihydrolipoamide acyltransferase (E2) component